MGIELAPSQKDRFAKKKHFLDLILKNRVLDIYFCPFSKNFKRAAEKKVQKMTCDHYALISIFSRNGL